jgi:arylsulfatase A
MKNLLLIATLCLASIPAESKPNVVFIMADDLSAEYLSSYSKDGVNTPNIDSIGKRGVLFRTAWATSICGTTRSLLMTGKFANKTNYYHNDFSSFPTVNSDINQHLTIGKMFKDSGYTTQYVGKWGISGDVENYDDTVIWEISEMSKGTENGKVGSRYWHPAISKNGVILDTTPKDFGPDIFQQHVVEFIKNATGPYFTFYSMVAPHGMRNHTYPVIPNGVNGGLKGNYKSLVKYIDKQVGEILSVVDDNTIVVFCTDNATAREGKQESVERGCRVPFLICGGPVVTKGYTKQLLSFADILPTFAEFAEYGGPIYSDGISVKSFLTGTYSLTRHKMYSNIGTSRLVTDGKYVIESQDKVRKNPKGEFRKGRKNLKAKGRIYANLKRYGNYVGGPLLTKRNKMFRCPSGKKFLRFWINLGKKENKKNN